jgi:hypothetical protein
MEPALASPLATDSTMSMDGNKTPSVVSMDDPETRMAAEALSGLRNLGTFFSCLVDLRLALSVNWRAWSQEPILSFEPELPVLLFYTTCFALYVDDYFVIG